jgi:hypothetical protein
MDAFRDARLRSFEDRMIAHISAFFAQQYHEVGESGMREIIQYGIERSASYGIHVERDVCKYIDLMVVLGPDFDRDPALPWAGEILVIHEQDSPAYRVHRLCEEASIALGHATISNERTA